MPKLASDAIDRRLREVPGWQRSGDAITRQFEFASFPDAIAFVNRVAEKAEAADHHPDILVSYRRVTLTWSTHSEGGLTDKDFEGAKMADAATRASRASAG
jgi:4a-hydroxytetrahydrobiopterin dehydratase